MAGLWHLWLVYGWFMAGLWLVYGWLMAFMAGSWLVYGWFMAGLWAPPWTSPFWAIENSPAPREFSPHLHWKVVLALQLHPLPSCIHLSDIQAVGDLLKFYIRGKCVDHDSCSTTIDVQKQNNSRPETNLSNRRWISWFSPIAKQTHIAPSLGLPCRPHGRGREIPGSQMTFYSWKNHRTQLMWKLHKIAMSTTRECTDEFLKWWWWWLLKKAVVFVVDIRGFSQPGALECSLPPMMLKYWYWQRVLHQSVQTS